MRLQVLLDEERAVRLEREAIDMAFPVDADDRRAAGERILGAEPMAVPDVAELRLEIALGRDRRA